MMKFRYLVALPFEDHGSEIETVSSKHIDNLDFRLVRPKAWLSEYNFEVLRPAFTGLAKLVGKPDPQFIYQGGEILYRDVLHISDFVRTFEERCDALSEDRAAAMRLFYEVIDRLSKFTQDTQFDALMECVGDASSILPEECSAIFASIFFDEPVLREGAELSNTAPDEWAAPIRSLMFSNPYLAAWASQPILTSAPKRAGWQWQGKVHVAKPQEAVMQRNEFFESCDQIQVPSEFWEKSYSVYLAGCWSEELRYAWASFIVVLSKLLNMVVSQHGHEIIKERL